MRERENEKMSDMKTCVCMEIDHALLLDFKSSIGNWIRKSSLEMGHIAQQKDAIISLSLFLAL